MLNKELNHIRKWFNFFLGHHKEKVFFLKFYDRQHQHLPSVYENFWGKKVWSKAKSLTKGYNNPLSTLCWKMPIFQSKLPITKSHHISLNSQFNVVLGGIICFSVQFCDNSLLKMRFQVFPFASKKIQGFSGDRKILMPL